MTGTGFVTLRDVQKSYDGLTRVVESLDLDIHGGEFLTLLGPSGSGKTTVLMMLAGFEAPSAGDILLQGRSLLGVPPHRRDFGVVFQSYALFLHMTVAENVGFPLRVRGLLKSDIARRVAAALELVRLDGLGARMPAQLSGGQQQRVALARALVFEPRLVLMDEPLGALDKQLREQMQTEIKQLHARLGVTVVYVTHDQSEALTMSDRIAVFHAGRVQQIDTPRGLYERPANLFVANFIGENNAVPATLRAATATGCVLDIGGQAVQARCGPALSPGTAAVLVLRPEQVMLDPPPGLTRNRLAATVAEVVYHGDHTRLRARLADGGADIIVKRPNAGGVPQLPVGAAVTLGWDAEHCFALPHEGAA